MSLEQETYFEEAESTSFSTTGTVKTSDGREISFNVAVLIQRQIAAPCSKPGYLILLSVAVNVKVKGLIFQPCHIRVQINDQRKDGFWMMKPKPLVINMRVLSLEQETYFEEAESTREAVAALCAKQLLPVIDNAVAVLIQRQIAAPCSKPATEKCRIKQET